jgi:hypothetical protein
MSTVLYINNKLVELDSSTVIAMNFQVNDLAEIADRNVNFSNTIKIPKTPSNIKLFELLGMTGNLSLVPYSEVRVKLINGLLEVVNNGLIAVQDTSKGFFSIVIFDGITSFKQAIDGLTLRNIDFDDINHYQTLANMVASLSNTDTYIYPLVDFEVGIISPDSITHYANTLLPCAFYHNIFERIFEAAGFTYDGDIFSLDKFIKTVMPITGKLNVEFEASSQFAAEYNSGNPATFQTFGISGGGTSPDTQEMAYDTVLSQSDIAISSVFGQTVFTFSENTQIKFDLFFQKDDNDGVSGQEVTFEFTLRKNGTAENVFFTLDSLSTGVGEIFEASYVMNVEAGDIVWVDVVCERTGAAGGFIYSSQIRFTATETTSNRELMNSWIDFGRQLPELEQYEFVKMIMQQYGLVAIPSGKTHIHFVYIKDILNKVFGFVDWTDKLVLEEKEEYKIGEYAKANELTYKYLDDNDTGFADYTLNLDVYNLQASKVLFENKITMPRHSTAKDSLIIPKIPLITYEKYDEDNKQRFLFNGDGKVYAIVLITHSLTNSFLIEEAPVIADDPAAGLAVFDFFTTDLKFGNVQQLYFDVLGPAYYEEFRKINERAQKKTLQLLLNIVDIKNLDFKKLVYFRQYQNFYYLNKISNWQNGKVCDGEFIRASVPNY